MANVDLFAIGNALIDQEFKVSDDFLTAHHLQKGTMQLTDGDTQARLYQNLQATQVYKGQASGGSAANTTVAFSALGGSAFYGAGRLFCYTVFECISEYVFNREGRLQKFRDPVQESAKRAAVSTGRSLDRNRTGEIIFVQV